MRRPAKAEKNQTNSRRFFALHLNVIVGKHIELVGRTVKGSVAKARAKKALSRRPDVQIVVGAARKEGGERRVHRLRPLGKSKVVVRVRQSELDNRRMKQKNQRKPITQTARASLSTDMYPS